MATVEIVENPRRKRRRGYSAAQRRAGFGGKAAMGRSSRKRRAKRRRNPSLASYSNPRRRRTRSRYLMVGPLRRRRRRNPRFGPFNINLVDSAWIAGGAVSVEMLPNVVQKYWPGMPTTGLLGHAVKAGLAVVAGWGVGKVTNKRNGDLVTAGGISVVLLGVAKEYLFPMVPGLSGLMECPVRATTIADTTNRLDGFITTAEIAPSMRGFVSTDMAQEVMGAY